MLTSTQKKYLRSKAHQLEPIVLIGKDGYSSGANHSIQQSLLAHELIKIKFREFKDQKIEISNKIESEMDATIVGRIGNITIFYKQNPDPDAQKIKLPK